MRTTLFITILLHWYAFSQKMGTFDDHIGLEKVFKEYIKAIDSKNMDSIVKFFDHTDCTFHFGENKPIVINSKEELLDLFSSWINSPKSLYVRTKLEELNVVPVWDDVDTKLCTVDATYSRIGNGGAALGRGRSLYHFYREKYEYPYRLLKKWKEWKLYMISDLAIEDRIEFSD